MDSHRAADSTPTGDRRQFLRGATALVATASSAVLFGALPGCAGSERRSPAPRSTTATTLPPTTTEVLDPAAWTDLGHSLAGTLVLPSAPTYAQDKLVYNLRYATVDPAAVAYCAGPTDVQRCLDFARRHGLTPTARSGGHSYGGYSTGTGLVIDVSPMHGAVIDAGRRQAVVGTGTQLIDLYQQVSDAGFLVPGGSCPTVGIAGLTLGGGIGVVARKYGLTCDNLEALDVVTADGRLLTCTADTHADLFWAHRGGGGGNFGVATSFTFALHPLPPLALFTVNWPWEAAAAVLGQWQQWTAASPDELWSNCQLLSSGGDGLSVRCNGVFVGSTSALSSLLQPLLAGAGTPSSQFVGPEEYLHAMLVEAGCQDLTVDQCHLTAAGSGGTLSRSAFAASSAYATAAFSDAGVRAAVQAVQELQESDALLGGGLVFDAYGGAINAVAADATAFVHRHALCAMQASISWGSGDPPSTVAAAEGWLAATTKVMQPFVSNAAYQNYIDPTLVDWADAYYGANLPRLMAVKRRYDPDDVFHFAQSIPTALPR